MRSMQKFNARAFSVIAVALSAVAAHPAKASLACGEAFSERAELHATVASIFNETFSTQVATEASAASQRKTVAEIWGETIQMSPELFARLKASDEARALSQRQAEREDQLQREMLKKIESETKRLKSASDWSKLMPETKEDLLTSGDLKLGKLQVHREKFGTAKRPLKDSPEAMKIAEFMKSNANLRPNDGYETEVTRVGDLQVTVEVIKTLDGKLLGSVYYAYQPVVFTGGKAGNTKQFKSFATAERRGFSEGTENYQTEGVFDENGRPLSFDAEMRFDH